MQKPFEDAAYGLEVGKISDVILSDSGVHLVLRTGWVLYPGKEIHIYASDLYQQTIRFAFVGDVRRGFMEEIIDVTDYLKCVIYCL